MALCCLTEGRAPLGFGQYGEFVGRARLSSAGKGDEYQLPDAEESWRVSFIPAWMSYLRGHLPPEENSDLSVDYVEDFMWPFVICSGQKEIEDLLFPI